MSSVDESGFEMVPPCLRSVFVALRGQDPRRLVGLKSEAEAAAVLETITRELLAELDRAMDRVMQAPEEPIGRMRLVK